MSPLKGYVGPADKIRKYFGRRKKTVNHPEDIKIVRELLNKIPSNQGGPEEELTLFDDVTHTAIFAALARFQKEHGIVNRRNNKPYGWTGPKGQTLAAMNRIAVRASQPERQPGYLDISRMNYSRLKKDFFGGRTFREEAGDQVFSSRGSLNNAKGDVNTCALRVSYAMLKAGKTLRPTAGSWKYKARRRTFWLTSTAERLANELANGEFVVSKRDIIGRKGVIVFLGGYKRATGHATLWNGSRCQLGAQEGRWEFPTIYFFETKG